MADADELQQQVDRLLRRTEEQDRKIDALLNMVRGLPDVHRGLGEVRNQVARLGDRLAVVAAPPPPAGVHELPEPSDLPPEHKIQPGPVAEGEGAGGAAVQGAVQHLTRAERRRAAQQEKQARRQAFLQGREERRKAHEQPRELRRQRREAEEDWRRAVAGLQRGPAQPAGQPEQPEPIPQELQDLPQDLARRVMRERHRFDVALQQERLAEQRVRELRASGAPEEQVTAAVGHEQRAEQASGRAAERLQRIEQEMREARQRQAHGGDRQASEDIQKVLEKVERIAENIDEATTARYA